MPRTVKEWIGKNDDETPPPRVRARVFEAKKCRCHKCRRLIRPGEGWTLEHLIAIINGGRNAEDNLDVTCDWCLPAKNAEDAAIKKHGTAVRYQNMGIRPEPTFQSRNSFPPARPRKSATTPHSKQIGVFIDADRPTKEPAE